MNCDVVFVHGTGVREPAYSKTFNIISKQLKDHNKDIRVHRCYWGEHGSTMMAGGNSLPKEAATKAIDDNMDSEQLTLELWRLLYQDPLFELKILAVYRGEGEGEFVLGQEQPGESLAAVFSNFKPSSEDLLAALNNVGLPTEILCAARDKIIEESDYKDALASAKPPLGEYRDALARALVAQSVILTQELEGELALSLDAAHRDNIVQYIAAELGEQEKGLDDWLQDNLMGIFTRIGTTWLRDRRHPISERISTGGGDILLYQSRGQKIRTFVSDILMPLTGRIVLIAHSLGGIVCVDLLLLDPAIRSRVELLVTVGSQAPALYELNALVSQPYDPNFRLPINFPYWLNFYDLNDFLSYVGRPIFVGNDGSEFVEDVEIQSGQPFPISHSAYWIQQKIWKAIFKQLPHD